MDSQTVGRPSDRPVFLIDKGITKTEDSAVLSWTTILSSLLLFISASQEKMGCSEPSLEPSDLDQIEVEHVSNIWKTG